jgi:hypothetical protein
MLSMESAKSLGMLKLVLELVILSRFKERFLVNKIS